MVAEQIKAADFDTKRLKISSTSVRYNQQWILKLYFLTSSWLQEKYDGQFSGEWSTRCAHAGRQSLKSKENYVSAKDESTKAINKILADTLSGEESLSFNQIVQTEDQC